MKVVIILSLLAILAFVAYWRLRPYIQAAQRMFRFVQGARGVNAPDSQSKRERVVGRQLVRCSSCGTWVPSDRALMLKSSPFCSTDCVEQSSATQSRQRKSANL
ncbi:MAG TPA: hypothetical protein VK619_05900 [Pyrinomonadaceae bacterium]|nr:hypothetical protein [Pyrinomonadaceae bacterium]